MNYFEKCTRRVEEGPCARPLGHGGVCDVELALVDPRPSAADLAKQHDFNGPAVPKEHKLTDHGVRQWLESLEQRVARLEALAKKQRARSKT